MIFTKYDETKENKYQFIKTFTDRDFFAEKKKFPNRSLMEGSKEGGLGRVERFLNTF